MSKGGSDIHYHYFDMEEPRPGAHSFDATYFMYKIVELSGKLGLTLKTSELVERERSRKGAATQPST